MKVLLNRIDSEGDSSFESEDEPTDRIPAIRQEPFQDFESEELLARELTLI